MEINANPPMYARTMDSIIAGFNPPTDKEQALFIFGVNSSAPKYSDQTVLIMNAAGQITELVQNYSSFSTNKFNQSIAALSQKINKGFQANIAIVRSEAGKETAKATSASINALTESLNAEALKSKEEQQAKKAKDAEAKAEQEKKDAEVKAAQNLLDLAVITAPRSEEELFAYLSGGDGKISNAAALIKYDLNGDGVVDNTDYAILTGIIADPNAPVPNEEKAADSGP